MMLGVLHGVGSYRPKFDAGSRYFASLMDGIVEGAFNHGYAVTLCPQLLDGFSVPTAIHDGRFDGLIWYSGIPSEENHRMLMSSTVPIVAIHAQPQDYDNRFPTVICDNAQGIGLAVDHLVSLGHERIAFAVEAHYSSREGALRMEAFEQHMLRHRLPHDQSDVLRIHWDGHDLTEYLSKPLAHTAIIANHDAMAATIMRVAIQAGISIPADLSIIGFDSTDYCRELRPALTSIRQPLSTLGAAASDLLVHRIQSEKATSPEIVIPCGLDIRESTTTPHSRVRT
jgi:LacI family transcriptional regulator